MKGCAIPGCTDPCRSGQLMCKWHWRKVPADMKRLVNATWAAVQSFVGPVTGLLEKTREYKDARNAAIDHVCEQEGLRRAG